ncbi:MAG: DNA polymerase III subunit alpha [Nitriliruptorales bacterium]
MIPFAHLSVRTAYSLREGVIRPKELAAVAAELGMSHVAVTDRDGLYGAVRFAEACAHTGVTPVFGADLALEPDLSRPGWEITRAGRHRHPTGIRGGGEGPSGGPTALERFGGPRRDPTPRRKDDPRRSRPAAGPGWLEDDAARITLLARDAVGYGHLCRAISAAHRDARSSPHLAWEDAFAHPEGLYVLHGPDSPVGRLVADERPDAAAAELRRWVDAFGRDQVLVGVRHHLAEGDDRLAARTVVLADRLELAAVAVNDVRYLVEGDAYLADILACVREQVPVAAHHVRRRTAEAWLKTAADLSQIPIFRERPDLLLNAHRIARSCEVDLGLHRTHVPSLTGLDPAEARRALHARCETGVRERYEGITAEVADRLDAELAMIDRLGLHDYFLSVAEIVDGIRDMGVLCACRGSAAGSLVCYALRISDVDPVGNGLVFERFMNPYRDELPDIDVDVESARREDVYRMVMDRFGEERTACVAMVETFQARMAIREVAKTLGLPPAEIDLVAKAFGRVRARDVRAAMASLPELRGVRLDAGQLETLFQVVERIDGFPRHLALHPCGIVLGSTDLRDRTPVERSANGFAMSQFDKDDVAALGLLKLDVLAIRLLSAMRHAIDLLPATTGEVVDFHDIPPEDPEVYALLRSTRSVGVFQVESPGQRELLGRIQPSRFGDLVVEISLFRPGPVKADMIGPFVARHRGEEEVTCGEGDGRGVLAAGVTGERLQALLGDALGETHGVVVYHEQVMKVVAALTGCDLAYADLVRRELGDDRKLPALKAWALARARERGIERAVAEEVWRQVASFASFGFCKSHAAAFAVPTYRSAWLKRHHLPEFTAGLLTHDPGMYPRRLLLDEARNFGVAVLGPDVNASAAAYTVEAVPEAVAFERLEVRAPDDLPPGWSCAYPRPTGGHGSAYDGGCGGEGGRWRVVPPGELDLGAAPRGPDGAPRRWAVRIGLQDVKGMSGGERERLLAHRPYASLEDLRFESGVSRPTAEALCKAGALDALTETTATGRRRLLLRVEELWGQGVRGAQAPRGIQGRRGREAVQVGLDLHADHRPQLPPATLADAVRDELEVLGLDWTRHVVAFYEPLFGPLGVTRAHELLARADGERIRVAGVRVALQSPPVRSGQRVLFLSLDDRTGTTQANFFERTLEGHARTVLHSWLVVVEGRLRRSADRGATIIAERAWDLTALWRAWEQGRLAAALRSRSGADARAVDLAPAPAPAGLSAAMFASGSR